MLEKDYLDPLTIKSQCSAAITEIDTDNSALTVAYTAVDSFINDTTIKSDAFDALKSSFRPYLTIITRLKNANESDKADFETLKSSVGSEVLDGSVIVPKMKAAWESKTNNENTANYYYDLAASTTDIMLSSSYSQIGSSFSTLAGFDYLTYLYWKRKSDKFDEIEGATSGLFSGSATSRSYCVKDPSRPNSKGLSTDVNNTLATDSMKGKMAKRFGAVEDVSDLYYKVTSNTIDIDDLTDEQKELIVEYYEALHPDDAEALAKATKKLSDDEAIDLKARVYTAPPRFKDNFINNVTDAAEAKEDFDKFDNGKISMKKLSNERTAAAVAYYDIYHLDEARTMTHNLLPMINEGYDDHVNNIKLLAYTADEPYKSVFLENVQYVKIEDIHSSSSYEWCHGIYINVDDMGDASDASENDYRTYFHEMSHGIDDHFKWKSNSYSNANGTTLDDTLQKEVRQKIEDAVYETIEDEGYTKEEQKKIVETITNEIMNTTNYDPNATPSFNGNVTYQGYYSEVVEDVKEDVINEMSDVYGGYTGNTLRVNWGHDAVSDETRSDGTTYERTYWLESDLDSNDKAVIKYDSNGNVIYSGSQEKEFFAESMSAHMTGADFGMDGYNGYSEETKEIFEEIVKEMDAAS